LKDFIFPENINNKIENIYIISIHYIYIYIYKYILEIYLYLFIQFYKSAITVLKESVHLNRLYQLGFFSAVSTVVSIYFSMK